MFDIKTLALLKHGKVWGAKNVVESALLNKWGGGGASYEKTVGPASIISISDAKPKPAKSLIVGMEPIQDLHGYDSPWPAGGGKNKFDKSAAIVGKWLNVTTGEEESTSQNYALSDWIPVKSNTAYSYTTPFSSRRWFYDTNKTPVEAVGTNPYTPSVDGYIRLTISIPDVDINTFMVVEGSSLPQTYSPYSNICPISGRTGVTVTRTGKNILEPSNVKNLYVGGTTGIVIGNGGILVCFRAKKGATYTIGGTSGNQNALYKTTLMPNEIASGQSVDSAVLSSYPPITFTADEDVTYAYYANDIWNESIAESYWIELGSTASAYEPYSGTTYPVTWQSEAGTVYGGTVDLVSGVLTVDRAQIASYNGEALPGKWISDRDVYAEGTSPTTGAQVVYELAEPQTYQLTPQQIQMLKGANVLWSDADELTLTYIGTNPPNLLGGMLGGGLGNPQEPVSEEQESPPDEQETEETEEP